MLAVQRRAPRTQKEMDPPGVDAQDWLEPAVGPYERVENKDNVTIWHYDEKVVARYWRLTEEPPSQLDMTIYCCPTGCDADDDLQVLLEQTDHTHVQ